MNECEQKHDIIPQPAQEAHMAQENIDPNAVTIDPATGQPVVQPQQDPMAQPQQGQPMPQPVPGQSPQVQMQQAVPQGQAPGQQPMAQPQQGQPMPQPVPGQAPQVQMQQVAPAQAPSPPSAPQQNNVKTNVTSKANKVKK